MSRIRQTLFTVSIVGIVVVGAGCGDGAPEKGDVDDAFAPASPDDVTAAASSEDPLAAAQHLTWFGYICDNFNGRHPWFCVNNLKGASARAGDMLGVWQIGPNQANSEWNVWRVGFVSHARHWPFCASGGCIGADYWNGAYDGRPVYKIAWAPHGSGSGKCIDQRDYAWPQGFATFEPCSPAGREGPPQLFVYGRGRFLVGVYATNLNYAQGIGQREYLQMAEYKDGAELVIYQGGHPWKFCNTSGGC
jgi:hypothetical protein